MSGPCLAEAPGELWVSIRGPTCELVMGGEGGVAKREGAKQYLAHKGGRYASRAPGQQVAHIDRR
eukprot:4013188-Alexandrium_andersonii.AAC.1